jgi:hypothetical protein
MVGAGVNSAARHLSDPCPQHEKSERLRGFPPVGATLNAPARPPQPEADQK